MKMLKLKTVIVGDQTGRLLIKKRRSRMAKIPASVTTKLIVFLVLMVINNNYIGYRKKCSKSAVLSANKK